MRLVNALKKTLPKVKTAAVDEITTILVPMQKKLNNMAPVSGNDRKTAQITAELQAMKKRIIELEEILASQKSFLLEMGTKVHEIETVIGR